MADSDTIVLYRLSKDGFNAAGLLGAASAIVCTNMQPHMDHAIVNEPSDDLAPPCFGAILSYSSADFLTSHITSCSNVKHVTVSIVSSKKELHRAGNNAMFSRHTAARRHTQGIP
jgi:hypothetical protein